VALGPLSGFAFTLMRSCSGSALLPLGQVLPFTETSRCDQLFGLAA